MLEITTAARIELHEMLVSSLGTQGPHATHGSEEDVGFRLVTAARSHARVALGLTVDSVRPGDAVFDHEGRHVLLIAGGAEPMVSDLTLAVVDTVHGRALGLLDSFRGSR